MIKGIIFDADGTILDTMPVWLSLGRRYLETIGIAADASLDKKLFGTTVSEAVGYIRKEYNITAPEDEIISNILSMIEGFYKNDAELKKQRPVFGACLVLEPARDLLFNRASLGLAVIKGAGSQIIYQFFL